MGSALRYRSLLVIGMWISVVVATLALGVGSTLGVREHLRLHQIQKVGKETTGRPTMQEWDGLDRRVTWQYRVGQQTYEVKAVTGVTGFRPGEPMRVFYDPDRPSSAFAARRPEAFDFWKAWTWRFGIGLGIAISAGRIALWCRGRLRRLDEDLAERAAARGGLSEAGPKSPWVGVDEGKALPKFMYVGNSFRLRYVDWTGSVVVSSEMIYLFKGRRDTETGLTIGGLSQALSEAGESLVDKLPTFPYSEIPSEVRMHTEWPHLPESLDCPVAMVPRARVDQLEHPALSNALSFTAFREPVTIRYLPGTGPCVLRFLTTTGWHLTQPTSQPRTAVNRLGYLMAIVGIVSATLIAIRAFQLEHRTADDELNHMGLALLAILAFIFGIALSRARGPLNQA